MAVCSRLMASGYSARTVNETLVRADGVGGNGHAFEHAVRIAFQNAAVHERAGIAFVGVADDIFLRALRFGDRAPFEAGGKTRAAASAQAALDHGLHHFLRRHFAEHVVQRLITVGGDVSLNAFGINDRRCWPGRWTIVF